MNVLKELKGGVNTLKNKIKRTGAPNDGQIHRPDVQLEPETETYDSPVVETPKHAFIPPKKTAAELIQELDERYFIDDFDPVAATLNELPGDSSSDLVLENRLHELDLIKTTIDKKLSSQVMKNAPAFVEGMQLISDIKQDLILTSELCAQGRSNLGRVNHDLTISILGALQKQRKVARMKVVQSTLQDVHNLIRREAEITKLLSEGHFMEAVQIYKVCLGRLAQSDLNKFTCLDDLRKRFLRSGESINARIREQILTLCKTYDHTRFLNLIDAMISLGDVKVLSEHMKKYAPLAVDETCCEGLYTYVMDIQELKKKSFRELCQLIDMEQFSIGYLTVLSNLCNLLYASFRMTETLHDMIEQMNETDVNRIPLQTALDFLRQHKQPLWAKCQQNVTAILSSVYLNTTTIVVDDFLRVLNSSYSFISVGETYSKSNSDGLRGHMFRKSKEYVANFQKESFEVVKTIIESGKWQLLNVPDTFSIDDIKEFRVTTRKEEMSDEKFGSLYEQFLRGTNPFAAAVTEQQAEYVNRKKESVNSDTKTTSATTKSATGLRPPPISTSRTTALGPVSPSPHSARPQMTPNGNTTNNLRYLLASIEFEYGYRDVRKESEDNKPIVTASSLTLCRYIGKSTTIMSNLSPLAMDVFQGLHELFDFYVYAIFCLFGLSQHNFFVDGFEKYPTLRKCVNTVKTKVQMGTFAGGFFREHAKPDLPESSNRDLASPPTKEKSNFLAQIGIAKKFSSQLKALSSSNVDKHHSHPQLVSLSDDVDIDSNESLYGIIPRCIACESLAFIVTVISQNADRIRTLLPVVEQSRIDDFVTYVTNVRSEFSTYIFRNLAPIVLPKDAFMTKLNMCRWDITDLQTKYNPYVDSVLNTLRASDLSIKSSGGLPRSILSRVWTETIAYLAEHLVESYSKAKKCTTEGRGLMTLDSSALKSGLEKLTNLKPLPHWDFVHGYVNAYYLQEGELLQWVQSHPEYKLDHVVSIAQCGCGSSKVKKDRVNLINAVTEVWHKTQEEVKHRKLADKQQSSSTAHSRSPSSAHSTDVTSPSSATSPTIDESKEANS